METTQVEEETAIPQLDELTQAQEQRIIEAGGGEETPQEEQRPEPSKDDALPEGGAKTVPTLMDLGYPIIQDGSSIESETSEDLRSKVEKKKKKKARSLISIRRHASKTVRIQEPYEKEILLEVSTDDEEETNLGDGKGEKYERYTVEVGEHTKKVVSMFDDDEDQEIYKLKTDATMKHRIHQDVDLQSLEAFGVKKKFVQYLCRIGFGWFIQLGILQVPLMLAVEFFTTFRFTANTDLDRPTISFRLFGLEFEMNLSEWAVRMGVATASEVEKPYWRKIERGVLGKHITFDGRREWKKIAGEDAAEFSANKSLGADIKDPVLRLVQIYLGFNLL